MNALLHKSGCRTGPWRSAWLFLLLCWLVSCMPTPPTLPTRPARPTSQPGDDRLDLTILFDNNTSSASGGLKTAWGFSCLVETPETVLLFDTGGDAAILQHNATQLGKSLAEVEYVVLSHEHGDHTGGLAAVWDAGAEPVVYAPQAFPAALKRQISRQATLVEVTEAVEILPGMTVTRQVPGRVTEIALAVRGPQGWVVLTGCAHPGVVKMVRAAQENDIPELALVMGGFHLRNTGEDELRRIFADLQALGARAIAPTHCSGDLTRSLAATVYGDGYREVGAGSVLTFEK